MIVRAVSSFPGWARRNLVLDRLSIAVITFVVALIFISFALASASNCQGLCHVQT